MNDRQLQEEISEMLGAPASIRKAQALIPMWIPYDRAEQLMFELSFLLEYPSGHRAKGLSLIAPSNSGKTTLLKLFQSEAGKKFGREFHKYIVYAKAKDANQDRLGQRILKAVGHPAGSEKGALEKAFVLLKNLGARCLIIDEVHRVLAGTGKRQETFLNHVVDIGDDLGFSTILSGILSAETVIQSDDQVESRWPVYKLQPWSNDDSFLELLVQIEATLPLLHESRLWEHGQLIHDTTHGILGNVVEWMRHVAGVAIDQGIEKINIELLEQYAHRFSATHIAQAHEE